MMQLREQIRKLLDRGYSLPFTGRETLRIHHCKQLDPSLESRHHLTCRMVRALTRRMVSDPHSSCFLMVRALSRQSTFCNRLAAEFLCS